MGNGKKTFVKITNQDIFAKITAMHDDLLKIQGKVKLNRWVAGTALTVSLATIGAVR